MENTNESSIIMSEIEHVNMSLMSLIKTFDININFIDDKYKDITSKRDKINKLLSRRNELIKEIAKIEVEISDINRQITNDYDYIISSMPDKFISSAKYLVNYYTVLVNQVGEDVVKVRYPELYKFVKIYNKVIEMKKDKEVNMFEVVDEDKESNVKKALKYYFVTNFEYAKLGKSTRITQSAAASKYGISSQTLNRTMKTYIDKGLIVNVYSPYSYGNSKRKDKEIKDACKYVNGKYVRDTSISINEYKKILDRVLNSKHY